MSGDLSTSAFSELEESGNANSSLSDPAPVNRGIRALCDIRQGEVLGEYTGELLPTEDLRPKDDYAFTWWSPDEMKGGREVDGTDKIAILSGEYLGNWTRFINQDDSQNIEFEQEAISGKMRIVVRAIKPIKFGEQVYGHYGPGYFPGEEPPKNKKRKVG